MYDLYVYGSTSAAFFPKTNHSLVRQNSTECEAKKIKSKQIFSPAAFDNRSKTQQEELMMWCDVFKVKSMMCHHLRVLGRLLLEIWEEVAHQNIGKAKSVIILKQDINIIHWWGKIVFWMGFIRIFMDFLLVKNEWFDERRKEMLSYKLCNLLKNSWRGLSHSSRKRTSNNHIFKCKWILFDHTTDGVYCGLLPIHCERTFWWRKVHQEWNDESERE